MILPKINFIYYKNLLDICLSKFFEDNNSKFIEKDNQYIYCGINSRNKLKQIFKDYLINELKSNITSYSVINKQWYVIIGGCIPKDNILLSLQNNKLPIKLQKIINQENPLKYYLKESDIILDINLFNQVFEDVFNEFFKSQKKILKSFGKEYTNIIFIKHTNADCDMIYKICKSILGKSNTVNMFEKLYINNRTNILAINDFINKYVHNKRLIEKTNEFKSIVAEIKQFLSESMSLSNGKE